MRLALYTDYSFRLLIYLAARDPDLVPVGEIADAYGISRNHLTKIANNLGRNGYLRTVRGRNGGLRLASRPSDINAGAVARLAEQGSALVECFDPARNRCVITPACALKHALHEAEDAFYGVLDGYTLEDLSSAKGALRRLLGIHGPV